MAASVDSLIGGLSGYMNVYKINVAIRLAVEVLKLCQRVSFVEDTIGRRKKGQKEVRERSSLSHDPDNCAIGSYARVNAPLPARFVPKRLLVNPVLPFVALCRILVLSS